ncbi:MAG: hypothetical protein ACKVU4_11085 [Phycisphaerales bacterium]
MNDFLVVAGITLGAMLAGAGVLHMLSRLGSAGRAVAAAFCRAPLLDVPITYFTVAPLFAGPIYAGWVGLGGAVAGQVASVLVWGWMHELWHIKDVRRGPRIVTTINRMVGRPRNHAAAWLTATVTPVFWVVRVAEIFIYTPITWLIGLPRYRHADWVNVSRQKFAGLVGHDRIWCLYCDWMTGVWSLGTEMLRNVESFWCPIRFASGAKCENCKIDFPDVNNGWVRAEGTMAEVTAVIEEKYTGRTERSWFGHPARLTVEGREPRA